MDYDKIAHLYQSDKRIFDPVRRKAYQEWIDECNSEDWNQVIDLGCGAGQSTRLLIGKNRKIQGIDKSKEMLKLAITEETENPLGIKYYQANIFQKNTRLGIKNEKVDLISSFAVFHYAESKNELSNLFENISNILTPNGRIVAVILTPNILARNFLPGINTSSMKWLDFPYQNGSRVEVTLFGTDKRKICTLKNYNWHREVYEKMMRKFGFYKIKWKNPENINKMGLILLTARKK